MQHDTTLHDARDQCAARDAALAELPELRETLGQEVYRSQALEACIAEVEQNLEALQGLTPLSLIKSIVGSKQRSIDNANQELTDLKSDLEQTRQAIADLESRIEGLETSVSNYENAESAYASLLKDRESEILAGDGEEARKLQEVIDRRATISGQSQSVDRLIQSCKHAMERLESMNAALHRARCKTISRRNFGNVFNAATKQIAQGSVKRVAQGFEKVSRDFERLSLPGDTPLDEQIMQHGAEVAAMTATISEAHAQWITEDYTFAHRYLDGLQQLLGLLKDKAKDLTKESASLDDERRNLLDPRPAPQHSQAEQ